MIFSLHSSNPSTLVLPARRRRTLLRLPHATLLHAAYLGLLRPPQAGLAPWPPPPAILCPPPRSGPTVVLLPHAALLRAVYVGLVRSPQAGLARCPPPAAVLSPPPRSGATVVRLPHAALLRAPHRPGVPGLRSPRRRDLLCPPLPGSALSSSCSVQPTAATRGKIQPVAPMRGTRCRVPPGQLQGSLAVRPGIINQ